MEAEAEEEKDKEIAKLKSENELLIDALRKSNKKCHEIISSARELNSKSHNLYIEFNKLQEEEYVEKENGLFLKPETIIKWKMNKQGFSLHLTLNQNSNLLKFLLEN